MFYLIDCWGGIKMCRQTKTSLSLCETGGIEETWCFGVNSGVSAIRWNPCNIWCRGRTRI